MRQAQKKILYLLGGGLVYLYFANAFIYYRIGQGNLSNPDQQYIYQLGVPAESAAPLRYVALGDSLTAGAGVERYEDSYPYQVAARLSAEGRAVELTDISYLGAKSVDVIEAMLEPAIAADPDVVTVLIGVNDVHNRVGTAEFRQNYAYILQQLQARTHADIHVVSIPYIGSRHILLPPLSTYFHYQTGRYNAVIASLAGEYGVDYIDIANPTRAALWSPAYYAADSFHPNARGYNLWANIIYDNIHR